MRLVIECKHGEAAEHWVIDFVTWRYVPCRPTSITDPDFILEALAEAGLLEMEQQGWTPDEIRAYLEGAALPEGALVRFVSPWKEAK